MPTGLCIGYGLYTVIAEMSSSDRNLSYPAPYSKSLLISDLGRLKVRCCLILGFNDTSKIQAFHLSASVCFPPCVSLILGLALPLRLQPMQGRELHPLHRKVKVLGQAFIGPNQPFSVCRGTGLTNWFKSVRIDPLKLRVG